MASRNFISSFHTEKGLQLRMTVWVVGTVLAVASIVMLAVTYTLNRQYEEKITDQLEKDIDHTVMVINQRMMRAEYITYTAASIIGSNFHDYESSELETAVQGLMKDVECIDVVSLTITDGDESNATNFITYNSMKNGKRTLVSLSPYKQDLSNDSNWIASYHRKQNIWFTHFKPKENYCAPLQCFSVPIYSPDSVCHGILCTMIMETFITKIVNEYNTSPDVSITIYNPLGDCITHTGEKANNLSEENVLKVERHVDRLKWRMIFSINKSVITDQLSGVITTMVASIIILLISLIIVIALAIRYVARPYVKNQQHLSEAKASMERELKIAADTQMQLIPHAFPPFPDREELSLYACLHPAREVGGDLYDYFINHNMLYFGIGDVSGKGVPASLFMAATHYLFRSVASVMPMNEAMQQINRSLAIDNEKCNFVTFFFARLDLATGILEYTNAGHNSPIVIHDGEVKFFAESDSSPLGIWDEEIYPIHTLQLSKGDTILLYTDGVTEAMSPNGEEWGNDKLLRCAAECGRMLPDSIIERVLKRVRQHADMAQQSDDITMLCVRYNGNND